MKMIIDVPEETYNKMRRGEALYPADANVVIFAIETGVPLSESEDCVSRQAAIDAADKVIERDTSGNNDVVNAMIAWSAYIKGLPPVKLAPKWIPCSERLPEEREWIGTKNFGTTISDEVYVTFEMPNGERFTDHLSFQNGKLSSYKQSEINTWHKGAKPIAWMPLPLPYKEGE